MTVDVITIDTYCVQIDFSNVYVSHLDEMRPNHSMNRCQKSSLILVHYIAIDTSILNLAYECPLPDSS